MKEVNEIMILPEGSIMLNLEDMRFVEGGGTVKLYLSKETINYALDGLVGFGSAAAAKVALTAALSALGGTLLVAMEAGTAGAATIVAGEFLTLYAGAVATIVSTLMGYYNVKTGKFSYKGKDIKLFNMKHSILPNKTIRL